MSSNKTTSRTRVRLIGAVASVAIAGAVGLGAISTGTVPVLADPVKLDKPLQAPSFADVVEVVSPAVVSVRVRGETAETGTVSAPFFEMPGMEDLPDGHPLKRFFDQFREDRRSERSGPRLRRPRPVAQGSGFFISEDGYLVTNNHVVQGGSEYMVVMDDGTEIDAELVGTDPRTDLAVLKVKENGRKFTYVDFADDGAVRVGDWVVAVGNPFGLGGTVTAGIVSARGREIGAGPYDDFIQIDAAVNRGNSGGPAFNLSGEVVGVNTAIFSPSGGNVGIAFAIPASLADSVVQELIRQGTVERGWLGVQIQDVTDEIAESLGLDEAKGALIVDAKKDEPAGSAGIRPGDVVIAVDGKGIASPRELARSIAEYDPGQTVEVTVWRSGEATNLDVELGEMPTTEQLAAAPRSSEPSVTSTDFGLSVTPAEDGEGLVVTDVEPGSAAEDVGVAPGDIIRSVNSQPVSSVEDMKAAVEAASNAGRGAVLVQVERENSNRFMALPIG
ncbi:Do family serine endopeptidase [Chelativorans salis]|uniref:Probable periplasmic serine endoprotease DegP-like n=1 Tax=Chelativorans salis TaxID=2978478 RepID=A0ABT2LQZ1_9HYPH|nr:Do family serine endopeptidase [Chelativorans sp. EGI FJ00035]MCT7376048.1 Do family serine endopeptidase [Chelativorans sp. EGI FJ00035]